MNIKLINRFLYYDKYKLRCAIGKRGITHNKKEGDQKTPKGTYVFNTIYYRKDKTANLKSFLKKKIIKKNMGWCDDPNSVFYNKLIKFPFNKTAEKMWLNNRIYDVVVIINYNLKPTIRNKGSAIFLHVAKRNYTPTKGCIAVSKKDILFLVSKINKKTKLIIN
jgi:L,D-peptidoglycan transpeptidase YkuD (ErfK/YbiS/YcfS/YnhG family)|tara:strand:- start:388 stop:879 length:492 start_codon:yes stop_codon:yes gene_type:complete